MLAAANAAAAHKDRELSELANKFRGGAAFLWSHHSLCPCRQLCTDGVVWAGVEDEAAECALRLKNVDEALQAWINEALAPRKRRKVGCAAEHVPPVNDNTGTGRETLVRCVRNHQESK